MVSRNQVRAQETPTPKPGNFEVPRDFALSMARRFKLIRRDGTVRCINGCDAEGISPSWRCPKCERMGYRSGGGEAF